ncbi:MAG: hypothetical protein RBR42_08670 [Desulfomicrobium sp.]|nr:hypothetical protein [Desulfomicrobium sp.]
MNGNRCGHDPRNPKLTPVNPIRKGKGGLPRILSLAAERAKVWYFHPKKCKLLQTHPHRQTRSERREACQIVIETILSHLDLVSLCLGTPTMENGFIDIDMKSIVRDAGISQRRCERAIALLKKAGFLKVKQSRTINDHGDYIGLRAIRVIPSLFFDFLNLDPMLQRERARATQKLQRRAMKAKRKMTDFMRRMTKGLRSSFSAKPQCSRAGQEKREELSRRWSMACIKYMLADLDPDEWRKRTNADLGLPADFSPGHYA